MKNGHQLMLTCLTHSGEARAVRLVQGWAGSGHLAECCPPNPRPQVEKTSRCEAAAGHRFTQCTQPCSCWEYLPGFAEGSKPVLGRLTRGADIRNACEVSSISILCYGPCDREPSMQFDDDLEEEAAPPKPFYRKWKFYRNTFVFLAR